MIDAYTEGEWFVEPQDDGSHWVLGPDPQDGHKVLVAPFEIGQDARHVVELHNRRNNQQPVRKAYRMMDRYANEMSDEAYRALEEIFLDFLG